MSDGLDEGDNVEGRKEERMLVRRLDILRLRPNFIHSQCYSIKDLPLLQATNFLARAASASSCKVQRLTEK